MFDKELEINSVELFIATTFDFIEGCIFFVFNSFYPCVCLSLLAFVHLSLCWVTVACKFCIMSSCSFLCSSHLELSTVFGDG